eukprot:364447-Chlamydomonas_euryale.AAC.20
MEAEEDFNATMSLTALYLSQLPQEEMNALIRSAPMDELERVSPRRCGFDESYDDRCAQSYSCPLTVGVAAKPSWALRMPGMVTRPVMRDYGNPLIRNSRSA